MTSIMKSMTMIRPSSVVRKTSICALSTFQPRIPTKSRYDFDTLSFASPEADFVTPSIQEIRLAERQAQRDRLEKKLKQEQMPPTIVSFASPIMTTYSRLHDQEVVPSNIAALLTTNSTISFTSPESDFTAPLEQEIAWSTEVASMAGTNLSFSSPESDFCASSDSLMSSTTTTIMDMVVPATSLGLSHLSFSSPECDFVSAPLPVMDGDVPVTSVNLVHLSFSSPECDFVSAPMPDTMSFSAMVLAWLTGDSTPTILTTNSHSITQDAFNETLNEAEAAALASLPRTLSSALRPSTQARVITESVPPFRITHVNDAWEGLCGFTRQEAVGKTLGMLQGPATDVSALMRLGDHVQNHQEISIELTNYTKSRRVFRNRLRIVPLTDLHGYQRTLSPSASSGGSLSPSTSANEVTHLLGVLEEVHESTSSSSASSSRYAHAI